MNIAIHIPSWVLWLVGIPLGIVILLLAAVGWLFLKDWGNGYNV